MAITPKVLLKRSSVVDRAPSAGDLEYGELAINFADGKLYYKNSSNDIKAFVDSARVKSIADAVVASGTGLFDSSNALQLIDSAYVQSRQTPQDFQYTSLTGSPNIQAMLDSEIAALIGGAPAVLDTLNELAAAIGDDPNFITTITNLANAQLDSAEVISLIDSAYVQQRQTQQDFAYSSLTGAPTNVSSFVNDANYLDSNTVTGVIDATYIQANQTAYDFLDSSEAIALIDSAYVQARQSLDFTFTDVANVAPTTGQIELGEIAINTHDGKMFFKRDADGTLSIREVGFPDRADNVLYVSENGNDSNDGSTIAEAYLTLDAALSNADSGTTIFLKSGSYTLNNTSGGVVVPTKVSIIGDNLRTTNISGQTATNDLLLLNNASYVTGVTFRGHTNGAAAVSFDPSAGNIITSPYVQNCSSITTTGTGMKIDGSLVGGLRSMVSDSFTQINFNGKGVHLLNRGYAQLVSIFTVSCDVGILCETGGNCSLTNSNCSFGNFGLKSTGSTSLSKSGTASAAAIGDKVVRVTGPSPAPNYGEAIKFANDTKYYTVEAISATGSPNEYDITLLEELVLAVGNGDAVTFHQRSLIQASSITFEYVGTGTGIYDTPQSGAFPIQANEVIQDSDNQGLVYFTSTDHKGDFRIGGDLTINRENGTITGNTFDKSLFAVLTPYILAIED
jgi:hypothetical protein